MFINVLYPEAVLHIKDVRRSIEAGDLVGEMLEKHLQETDQNITIKDSVEWGIERREKVLGIQPRDTASLEDRRLEVLIRWYDTPIYTERTLRQKLDASLGAENYVLMIDLDSKSIECRIELTRRLMFQSVQDLLEQMVPLDYLFSVTLRYNQYKDLKKFTYNQVRHRTWDQLRNEVITVADNA